MIKLLKAVSLSLALVAGATVSSTALASIVVTGLDDDSGAYSLVRSAPLTASVASTLTFDWSYFQMTLTDRPMTRRGTTLTPHFFN